MSGLHLTLIGIGTGNPEHLTLQAIRAINAQDLILIPRKGPGKGDLAELRRAICDEVLSNETTRIVEFDLPVRDEATADYRRRVDDWHDAIAEAWRAAMSGQPDAARAALLVWGDPSLYDSTLRIAARLDPAPKVEVIPGITSLQALTAAHAIPVNDIGAPFLVTTGRRLREEGWPAGIDTLAVMLDGGCAFADIDPDGVHIWWGGYVGMPEQIICEGPLAEVAERIVQMRAEARARHGWIMDIYILRRDYSVRP
ncbi:precorrin-6A synthase (deacetylating) [Sulfitobacter sp. EhC04]|uniref:precorrin-6A synthase (deacetylating) n=1 Tax=Sulfitobacter sp. EhC04 TaxID=1849168 RepID=UPI0007F334A0|nr:precorrin-6A synthase (deacetylating) [Sulfitobacter sp. EhC04]OAN72908.1 precorrin-6A synthase (deacetylating) [Sulfitobacter sp. EhC04]